MGRIGDFCSWIKGKVFGESVDNYGDEQPYDDNDYTEGEVPQDYVEITRPKNGYGSIRKMDSYMSGKPSFSFVSKQSEERESDILEMNVFLFSPESPKDVYTAADALKEGRIVVLNVLDSPITPDESQRMCDYLLGVSYAVGARVETITGDILMLLPKGCSVSTEFKKNLRKNSVKYA